VTASPVSADAAAVTFALVVSMAGAAAPAAALTGASSGSAVQQYILGLVALNFNIAPNAVSITGVTLTYDTTSARALQARVGVVKSASFAVRADAAALAASGNPAFAGLNPNANSADLDKIRSGVQAVVSAPGAMDQVAAALAQNPAVLAELGVTNAASISVATPVVVAVAPKAAPAAGLAAFVIPVSVTCGSILFCGLVYAFYLCFKRLAADADKEADAPAVGVVGAPAAAAPATADATAVTEAVAQSATRRAGRMSVQGCSPLQPKK